MPWLKKTGVVWFCFVWLAMIGAQAQTTSTSTFTDTTAPGWVFGGTGSTNPYLTAGVVPGDTAGNGWLRLTENTNNQSTFALLDNQIFSVNAQIDITMQYASWNGSGADGITFFLVDGGINSSTFSPGAYGGSMGYAQRTGVAGMPGGYLGFALDDYGNYSNNSEGRNGGVAGPGVGGVGGVTTDTTLRPNTIAVRGPESSNYAFIAASADVSTLSGGGQIDFPTATTRPDQTGADYRSFHITLDANNQLTVQMQFGASSSFTTLFTADLSSYDRPDYFKLGFTGATGGSTEIHEVRNLTVTTTPWQTGSTAFEWDNGGGTSSSATATNWVGDVALGTNGDVLFGDKPSSGPQTVTFNSNITERSLTFDTGYNYTLNGTGTITLGDPALAGLPSINVNDYNGAMGDHKINNALVLAEDTRINNYSYSTLCLNGGVNMGTNDISVNGYGAVNFNSTITGSGALIKNGDGITTIGADNFSTYTGAVTINKGMVVITSDGALGSTGSGTTVNDGGTLAFRGGVTYTRAEPITISGNGIQRGTGEYAGAIHNDGGNNSFAGNITMAANSGIGSRDGTLTLSGVISGAYSLTKLGAGVVELTNSSNSYSGATIIQNGVLRVSTSANALPGGFATGSPSGGNLQLAGGVLEINVGTTFSRQLGTSADQVQWTGDGGFSAYGAGRTVTLTNSGGTAGGTLTWNAGSFVPTGNALLLSSDYSNNTVTLTNAIDLGGASREIRVANGSAAVDAIASGVLSNGGLVKTGAGTLNISGTNTYTGTTEIQGGALRGNVPSSSNITLNGGVLEINSAFIRSLGATGTNVQWTGDGGFAAYTNDSSVSLNNNSTAVTWGSTSFLSSGKTLILGSDGSDKTLTLNNGLNLNAGSETINVVKGTTSNIANGILAGVVSNGSLTVTGNGRLDSTAVNTLTGTVTVNGAELRLQGNGTMTSITGVTVGEGGTFTMDNSGTNTTNRLNNSASVTLSGGTLNLYGRTGNNDTTETVGAVSIASGANTINAANGGNTGSDQLTLSSLTQTAGATVNFTNLRTDGTTAGGTLGATGDNSRILVTGLSNTNGIVGGWATVGDNWAMEVNNTQGIAAFGTGNINGNSTGTYETSTTPSNWASTENISISGTATNDATRTVNSFRLDGSSGTGRTLDLDNSGTTRTLTLASGGILSVGAATNVITADNAGSIINASGSSDLIVHTQGSSNTLQINAQIGNNSGSNGLIKAGTGTLQLGGTIANSYTGTTYVNDGTLILAKSDGVTALAGNIVVGDGRGTDVLQINANEQIANTANVTLHGNSYGNGETKLAFGGTTAGITETFASLTIEGTAVLDFAGGTVCSPNYLYLSDLNIPSDGTLLIRNWIEFTDFLLVDSSVDLNSVLPRIQFEGYETQAYTSVYNSGWNQIHPVPEPSTYGLMMLGSGLAFYGFRRWRQSKSAVKA